MHPAVLKYADSLQNLLANGYLYKQLILCILVVSYLNITLVSHIY